MKIDPYYTNGGNVAQRLELAFANDKVFYTILATNKNNIRA